LIGDETVNERYFVFYERYGRVSDVEWFVHQHDAKLEAELRKQSLREDECVYLGEKLWEAVGR
jgi:hypothetical protein